MEGGERTKNKVVIYNRFVVRDIHLVDGIKCADVVAPVTLKYIDVTVNGLHRPMHTLVDCRAPVCMVNSQLIDSLNLECVDNVTIRGIFGSAVSYKMYELKLQSSYSKYCSVTCALD